MVTVPRCAHGDERTKEPIMKNTFIAVLSLFTLLSLAACTSTPAPYAKGAQFSQGPAEPAEARDFGARNTPSERSMMRDHSMPATAM